MRVRYVHYFLPSFVCVCLLKLEITSTSLRSFLAFIFHLCLCTRQVGFVKAESSLELSLEARDLDLVSSTRTKLAAAIEQYNKESGK